MMNKSERRNKKRFDFLGMHYTQATQKLRKNILFSLLVETGKNICFRCGKPIEEVDDLTIDHKEPWLGVSKELFWSLDNIAFSHHSCNASNHRGIKYSDETVRKAMAMLEEGATQKEVSNKYGICPKQLRQIRDGESRKGYKEGR